MIQLTQGNSFTTSEP